MLILESHLARRLREGWAFRPCPPAQLDMLKAFDMEKSTSLWFYIMKEAELMEDGLRLGPVGGRIVGEVFIGLLKADETSYWAARPNWTPVLPSVTSGEFRITDLLTFAGVVPPLDAVVSPPTGVVPPPTDALPPPAEVEPSPTDVVPPLQ